MDSLDGEPQVFVDPNLMSADGTVSVSSMKFSKDGSLCAMSITASGSDWRTIKVLFCLELNYFIVNREIHFLKFNIN